MPVLTTFFLNYSGAYSVTVPVEEGPSIVNLPIQAVYNKILVCFYSLVYTVAGVDVVSER